MLERNMNELNWRDATNDSVSGRVRVLAVHAETAVYEPLQKVV